MIICITGWFDSYDKYGKTGKKEFVVSHGVDPVTGRDVCLPSEHPKHLGCVWSEDYMEYVLLEEGETL